MGSTHWFHEFHLFTYFHHINEFLYINERACLTDCFGFKLRQARAWQGQGGLRHGLLGRRLARYIAADICPGAPKIIVSQGTPADRGLERYDQIQEITSRCKYRQ
jgi:hypothetical protein